MILQLYDLNHTRIAGLKNFKDAVVESELSTGDKTLSFLWHQNNHQKIPQEYYVRTDKDEFVVKENSKASKGYRKIVTKLNVEEIEGRTWSEFIIEGCTAQEAADYALTDTGWSCISTVPAERLRKISMKKVNSFQILEKILEAFTCEVKFDTLSKVVYLMEQVGEDKGAYFIDGLNLREITDSGDSYDYATIIIPIGADGLEITEINGGKNYLENYQYSNKKKSVIWEDTSYTDSQALMEDAAYRLNEISKPKKTYRAKTIDLAKLNTKYSALAYSVGDTATFISNKDGIREKQRITKTVEYIDNPQKNTCDISNTVLSFEEMQKKLFAAAECIGNITTDNGTVRGSSVDKINVTQIIGLEHYIAEDVDDMKVNYLYVKNELGTPYAVIGEGVFTNIGTTNLNVNNRADIGTAYINELHVEEFTGDRASFKTVEADNIAALEARLNKITSTEITVEYLEANYTQVNFANVEKEYVKNLFVDIGLISNATIVDGHITGNLDSVNINANCIIAGTLAVDRLMIRGSEDSLIYELNNITGALQAANVNTLNGEVLTPRTINCDRLVAGSITANEIASGTITGDKLVAGSITAREIASATITGDKIAANTITAIKINVNDLFAQDITATGVIRGAKLYGTYIETAGGKIGGFIIGANELYNGTNSMTSTIAGIYVGTEGIRQYNSVNEYVNIEDGKLTCAGADIKGSMYINNDLMMWHGVDAYGNAANYYKALGWEAYGDTYRLRVGQEQCIMQNLDVECSIQEGGYPLSAKYLVNNYADSVNCHKGIKWNACADGNYFTFRPYLPTNELQITKNDSVGLLNIFTDGRVKAAGSITAQGNLITGGYIMGESAYTNHAILLGHSGQDYVQFFEWGGLFEFYKSQNGSHTLLGRINSSGWEGKVNGTAKYLARSGNTDIPMVFNWYGQGGQPTWLWGGEDGINMYVYNPSNFSVNHAKSSYHITCGNGNVRVALQGEGTSFRTYVHSTGNALDNSVNLGTGSYRWKQLYAGTTAISTSDKNLKKDITVLTDLHEELFKKLTPVSFKFKDGESGRNHIGFIAQDVENAMSILGMTSLDFAGLCKDIKTRCYVNPITNEEKEEIVFDSAGNPDYIYSLRYEEFIALNTYMIQKLMKRVAELETYINMSKAIA